MCDMLARLSLDAMTVRMKTANSLRFFVRSQIRNIALAVYVKRCLAKVICKKPYPHRRIDLLPALCRSAIVLLPVLVPSPPVVLVVV